MENTIKGATQVISINQLLEHWQGHRRLTRKVIAIFPEDELFTYSIGGMRPFADMVMELLGIAEPGLREIVTGQTAQLNEHFDHGNSKAKLLESWDSATQQLKELWAQMEGTDFQKQIVSFGQFPGTVQSALFYFMDNEIHHRGQGYVYLRSLGIEPPMFYDRS
ncbi:DinB family protein [Maribacter sp. PR1]|uniref:DinB family protein n=1 Tax=Maribacter cobaltidurans TaxID=1178778 RepID=A0ABU7IZ34_9FLAO|nr:MULTISPECIES: DinB family protein [Maribacter]MDC6390868.1 DinB family protein [Maribacter sp. PR1]MEE1978260.1 DinB family protein [Maribacter cobaltidurans]